MLLIEYAYTHKGSWHVTPDNAKKGVDYICPQCETEIIFKKGEIRQPHFAHKANTDCTPEGVLHAVVKNQLAWRIHIQDALIALQQYCAEKKCNNIVNLSRIKYTAFDNVQVEYMLPDSRYRADIALLLDNKVVGIIEIFSTSRVKEQKWDYLTEQGIYCLEIDAKYYMESHGYCLQLKSNVNDLRPKHHSQLPCEDCWNADPTWKDKAKQMMLDTPERSIRNARSDLFHDSRLLLGKPTMLEKLESLGIDTSEPFF